MNTNSSNHRGFLRARQLFCAASAVALGVGLVAPAQAQSSASGASSATSSQVEEVVVTGTLVRGVAPVGTNVSSVSQVDIQRTGVSSTNQLLSTIPQVTNAFNILPVTPSSFGRSTFRPDIRNIGNVGHSSTLVLLDGHNMVGAGILQTSPDVGVIPPGAIERVEVVPDGGSSIYGSDAVAGIMNFITRTKFDGFEARANYGFADGYHAYTLSLTGGQSWSTGSFLLSYYRRENTPLLSASRDRPRQDLRSFGGNDFRVRGCSPGTVTVAGTPYALPNFTAGSFNACDVTALGTLFPREAQDAAFASLTQQIAPNIDFDVKALGSKRRTRNLAAQINNAGTSITSANPFFRSINGETSQTVAYSYAPVLGDRLRNRSSLADWQVTPELTWRPGAGWRVKAMFDYGWSETTAVQPGINSTLEAQALRGPGLTTATALNPYDLTRTNPAVIAAIANYAIQSGARQSLTTWKATADGPLWSLPGGDVRGAFGVQHQRETMNAYYNPNPIGVTVGSNVVAAGRNTDSIFGEVVVPIIGAGNSMPGVERFEIDFSARHDKYSDVGGTTNPKIGATWEVLDGLKFRGNWGTSFVAPSLADTTAAADSSVAVLATTVVRPGDPQSSLQRPEVRLQGGTPGLSPMPAHTWSVGVDLAPRQVQGLKVSLTFWHVDMEKRVGLVPFGNILLYTTPGYAPFYTANPTLAQVQAAAASNPGPLTGASSLASLYGLGIDPYTLVDARRKNLGTLFVDGIDYNVTYNHATEWGAIYGSLGGMISTVRKQQPLPNTAYTNLLANGMPTWNAQVMVGTDVGKFTATATMNYTPGYAIVGVANQTRYGAFHPVNLFFKYDFGHDLSATLNIDNVFDQQPPFANVSGGIFSSAGFLQASTLGRYVNFGVAKRF